MRPNGSLNGSEMQRRARRRCGALRRAALGCACALAVFAAPARAQEVQRCYPGPPLYILRELLGGEFSPERYREAILGYARKRCADGQELKLVSPAGRDTYDRLNESVALELCEPEAVQRETSGAGEAAILTFCRISKLAPARD